MDSEFPFRFSALSDVGKISQINEDAYAVEPYAGIFVVSDGMGGHQGGELASAIVIEDFPVLLKTALAHLKSQNPRAIRNLLTKAIAKQSKQLNMKADSEDGFKHMGATVVVLLINNNRAYIAHVGDSRIYRLRKHRLCQLTKDHSIVAELLDQGKITPAQAENHIDQGVITRYIGMQEKAVTDVKSFTLKKEDRFLLCTDGLTDMVSDSQIRKILMSNHDCQTACQKLVEQANNAGGHDNITVLVLDWLG
jgi:serine/threonine protein phosphatase PrpC